MLDFNVLCQLSAPVDASFDILQFSQYQFSLRHISVRTWFPTPIQIL